MRFTLTAGHRGDAPQAGPLIEGLPLGSSWPTPPTTPTTSPSHRRQGSARRHPQQPVTRAKYPLDEHLYAQRHLVECCFSKLKQFRRVATRFEKTARNYLAVVTLAAIVLWLR